MTKKKKLIDVSLLDAEYYNTQCNVLNQLEQVNYIIAKQNMKLDVLFILPKTASINLSIFSVTISFPFNLPRLAY